MCAWDYAKLCCVTNLTGIASGAICDAGFCREGFCQFPLVGIVICADWNLFHAGCFIASGALCSGSLARGGAGGRDFCHIYEIMA